MKVLVTGVKGQLGGDVVACLEAQNVPCWGVDIDDFDLTDEKAVRQAVLGYAPDVIVTAPPTPPWTRRRTKAERFAGR